MNRYETQVAAALDAVEVRPPDAFLWFGRRETVAGGDARERLVQGIAQRLHADFFGAGGPRPRGAGPVTAPDDEAGGFIDALSQSNGGRGAWQDGWHVAAPAAGDDDALRVVRRDGLALLAAPEHVRAEGEQAKVLLPKELRGLSPGFYIALGDSGAPEGGERAGLYWNVAAAGAGTLVARVSYALNGAGLPFSLELPSDPARYGRGDAALLVVARSDVTAVLKLLRPLLRALGPHLAQTAPAFTKPLARGLALAEQPAGATPFGEQRCGLLAEAIVDAGARRADERLGAVRERFASAAISLESPYLEPGSVDAYDRS